MQELSPRPFIQQLSHALIAIGIITIGIYFGQDIVVPLAMALLLAVLLRPVEAFLIRMGIPKVLAITMAVTLAVLVLVGVTLLLSIQISDFSDEWPKLKKNINDFYRQVRRWIRREYRLSYWQQDQYLKKAQTQTLENFQSAETLGVVTGPLGTLILLPIYVFLLLYYRTMLLHFMVVLFTEKHKGKVVEVLNEIKTIIQSYMVGLLLETTAVATLNCVGLLLLNVQYAILLGVMAAILNLVPYIGGLVSIALAVLVTFINHPDGYTLLGVVGVFTAVQFIDNNLLVPLIIGSKVKINALASIVGVLIGGALAGFSGMFLSIPAIAILKAIFDRIENLKAWGILLGDESPEKARKSLIKTIAREKDPPQD
ncbi:Putative transport protein YhhT [Dyadobacter sp. CECT 9275]|uniref:Transport protein YhhT n=1 Tax=Dyadobacter helix TaxID=2822344 RepID=A0A916JDS8_9BACT|nr:AI-2E family transporter [Dyadobacter sp. CECT 9275]CAG5007556.1 Putative transport protein YhhT [Dyadobacter sp. CECT 9275]